MNTPARTRRLLFLSLASIIPVAAQPQDVAHHSELQIREAISSIIKKTIQSGSGMTPEGVKFWTPVPPGNEDFSAVKALGKAAIPIVAEFLWTKDPRENLVAAHLLAGVREPAYLEPFVDVAKKHPSVGARVRAVRFLSSGSSILYTPMMEQVAANDPDPAVRSTASEILANWKAEDKKSASRKN